MDPENGNTSGGNPPSGTSTSSANPLTSGGDVGNLVGNGGPPPGQDGGFDSPSRSDSTSGTDNQGAGEQGQGGDQGAGTPPESFNDVLAGFHSRLGQGQRDSIVSPPSRDQNQRPQGQPGDTTAPLVDPNTRPNNVPVGNDPTPPRQPPGMQRVYDGLTPEETEMFRHMGNGAYAALYPKYIKFKDTETKLQQLQTENAAFNKQNMFEFEEGYQLDPEYKKLTGYSDRINAEAMYWQKQLASVEAGGEFTELSWDPQTQQYSYEAPVPGSPAIKVELQSRLMNAINEKGLNKQRMGEFIGKFKAGHGSYQQSVDQVRKQVFAGIDPENMKKLSDKAGAKLQMFPPFVRNRPEVKIAAELLVLSEGLWAMYQELQGKQAGQNMINRTTRSAGPANANNGAATPPKDNMKNVMDEFAKNGYAPRR